MPTPNGQRASDGVVLAIAGTIFVALTGWLAWQPRAAIMIEDAAEAEHFGRSTDQAGPVGFGAEIKRKPIYFGEWVRVFKSADVVENSDR
jgi:hypothetical protein